MAPRPERALASASISASAWPASSAAASNSPARSEKAARSASWRRGTTVSSSDNLILVVEDNKASSDLMAYLLRAAGHEVMTCTDGADAIEIAAEHHPRVIVMDLQLERMGGIEAGVLLAADPELRQIPRIAVTA